MSVDVENRFNFLEWAAPALADDGVRHFVAGIIWATTRENVPSDKILTIRETRLIR